MFFEDTRAAFANIRSGARPGASMTLAAWGSRRANPYFTVAARVAQGRLGKATPVPPDAPGPFRFEDPAPVLATLAATGWTDPAVQTETVLLTPPGGPEGLAAIQMWIGAAQAVIEEKDASAQDRAAIQAALADAFADFDSAEGLRVPAQIHFYTARG